MFVKKSLILISIFFITSCFVDEKDYSSNEEIKTCVIDDDCEFNERCNEDKFCEINPDCVLCIEKNHANTMCFHGLCLIEACELGWFDANGIFQDGCEYECEITNGGTELCDLIDNDCDNKIDEDTDFMNDHLNCNGCGIICSSPPFSIPVCVSGSCYYVCEDGKYDVDGLVDNGCESDICVITHGGTEICDLRDNNCDGMVDEGIEKTSISSCGPLCENCDFPNSSSSCVNSSCKLDMCDEGYYNFDASELNGCEYQCDITNGGIEICDNIDNNCNGPADEGLVCSCPAGMVLINSLYCIDKYEASRSDASLSSVGSATDYLSQPNVLPWAYTSLAIASSTCENAGKRLCTPEEWEVACKGPENTDYCYGNQYDAGKCNGIDAFCRCGTGEICEDASPCPYAHCRDYCGANFHIIPTNSIAECTNGFGVMDINGNVWERVQGGAGRGGAYNCGNSELLHKCSYIADWGTSVIANFGFRCCCINCPE
jgi:Sulfatase-modifying factor enzyme 1/Putative metal-binding motif